MSGPRRPLPQKPATSSPSISSPSLPQGQADVGSTTSAYSSAVPGMGGPGSSFPIKSQDSTSVVRSTASPIPPSIPPVGPPSTSQSTGLSSAPSLERIPLPASQSQENTMPALSARLAPQLAAPASISRDMGASTTTSLEKPMSSLSVKERQALFEKKSQPEPVIPTRKPYSAVSTRPSPGPVSGVDASPSTSSPGITQPLTQDKFVPFPSTGPSTGFSATYPREPSVPSVSQRTVAIGGGQPTGSTSSRTLSGGTDREVFKHTPGVSTTTVASIGSTGSAYTPKSRKIVSQSEGRGIHSFLQEERDVFATILTESLGTIDRLSQRGYFPVATGGNDLFYKIEDGVLLAHFINVVREGTILEKAINMPSRYVSSESEGVSLDGKSSSVGLNHWQKTENLNLVINSAKNIGCQIINIHAHDLAHCVKNKQEYLALGLIWQLARLHVVRDINLTAHPELAALLLPNEEITSFLRLHPEEVLIRWLNYHLQREGFPNHKLVNNLDVALQSGTEFVHLLHSINPSVITTEDVQRIEPIDRANKAFQALRALQVNVAMQPKDIITGNKRLNTIFLANIFNKHPGLVLEQVDEELMAVITQETENEEDSREIRMFRHWLNSLGLPSLDAINGYGSKPKTHSAVQSLERSIAARTPQQGLSSTPGFTPGGQTTVTTPGASTPSSEEVPICYVESLLDEVDDGILLLRAIDCIVPGSVNWSKVNPRSAKLNIHRRVENCNHVLQLGKTPPLSFSLVGIGGADLTKPRQYTKFVLSFLWQLLRYQLFKMLVDLGGGQQRISDQDVVLLANDTVRTGRVTLPSSSASGAAIAAQESSQMGVGRPKLRSSGKIVSLKDPSLGTSLFFFDLLNILGPNSIDQSIVTEGLTPEEKENNAKYCITVTRKLGVNVFVVWEDIVEVRPNMMLALLIAILHAIIKKQQRQ